jgi:hypothetical protein
MPEPKIEFGKDYLLTPKGQGVFTIRETDLKRLDKMVGRIDQRGGFNQNMGFFGAGAVIGATTALIGLMTAQNVLVWRWAILAISCALAVIGFFNSLRERQNLQVSKQAILEEFQVIREGVDATAAETTAPVERT